MIAGLVLWVGALPTHAARATAYSESVAFVDSPDYVPQGSSQSSLTLTSSASIEGTQPENLGATASARTGPGTMGVQGSVLAAGQRSGARAQTGDAWQMSGSPVGSNVPMGLRIRFSGTLDPWMVDPSLPIALADMYVDVQYLIDVDPDFGGDETQFRFVQQYGPQFQPGQPVESSILSVATFTRSGEVLGEGEDVSQYLVFSGNTVSFDHTFDWTVPAGSFTDFFQAQVSINSYPANSQSSHAIDFFSTFNADPISNDPNVVFHSDGGRTTVPAPEPSGLMLVGAGLAAMAAWGARRRRSDRRPVESYPFV